MTEASDALVIARWAWPERDWYGTEDPAFVVAVIRGKEDERAASMEEAATVAEVESIIVQRGLGEQYGRALAVIVFGSSSNRAGDVWPTFPADFEDLAMIRTAPLSAITRALAATIRATKEKKT